MKSHPLYFIRTGTSEKFDLSNEKLALSCGLSLHTAMILAVLEEKNLNNSNDEVLKNLKEGFKRVLLPDEKYINHGKSYFDNFAVQLHFNRVENCYDILSLANVLFMLELYTLIYINNKYTNQLGD